MVCKNNKNILLARYVIILQKVFCGVNYSLNLCFQPRLRPQSRWGKSRCYVIPL